MKLLTFLAFALVASSALATEDCIHVLPDGSVCPDVGQDFFPDRNHCSKYWDCFDGCATHMLCQSDYLYDIEHKWCNTPQDVTCGERDCDGRDCHDNHHEDFDCPEENGYFADPENCIKYYHCYHNDAERLTCEFSKILKLLTQTDSCFFLMKK